MRFAQGKAALRCVTYVTYAAQLLRLLSQTAGGNTACVSLCHYTTV